MRTSEQARAEAEIDVGAEFESLTRQVADGNKARYTEYLPGSTSDLDPDAAQPRSDAAPAGGADGLAPSVGAADAVAYSAADLSGGHLHEADLPVAHRVADVARRHPAWTRRYVTAQVLLDVVIAALAVAVAALLSGPAPARSVGPLVLIGLVATWPLLVGCAHGYDRTRIGVGSDEIRAVLRAVVAAVAAGGFLVVGLHLEDLRLLVVAAPAAGLVSIIARYASRKHLHHRQRSGVDVRSVVVVGDGAAVGRLIEVFGAKSHCGMRVVAACVPVGTKVPPLVGGENVPVLEGLDRVISVVREFGADTVAVAAGHGTRDGYLRSLSWALEGTGIEMLVDPGLVEVAGPRLHVRPFVGLPLLHVEEPHFTGWRRTLKRAVDIVGSGLGLVLLSPLFLVVAAAIKFEDRGPVFFRQRRVGKDGTEFTIWKFRSMRPDAEQRLSELAASNEGSGPLFKLRADPRITRVGAILRRYSIDELPQLINVLNHSMSLVGPRPPLPSEVAEYQKPAHRRLLVKPGLTGLWQVSGRSDLAWDETVRLDLRYVENWSLTLDLLIMWKTLFAVLGRRGAY